MMRFLPEDYYTLLRPLLFKFGAETAHNMAIWLLKRGWIPHLPDHCDDRLNLYCAGMAFANPVGLSAGFDKNAEVFSEAFRHGFGFAEVGTLTLMPQEGNPKPRMFRLSEDQAIINRLGFNNKGVDAGLSNIATHDDKRMGVLGINIGKNKVTEDALDDYIPLLNEVYAAADYITINISSPNTKDLRVLQTEGHIGDFVKAIMQERNGIAAYNKFKRPVFVKISPDMDESDLDNLLDVVTTYHVDGLIVNNTTIARPDALRSSICKEQGGLSGAPLTQVSNDLTRKIYKKTNGTLTLIGVGGIMNGANAVQRVRSGATLVQIYSGMIYRGLGLVQEIKQALSAELDKEGLASIQELIGIDAR